MATPTASEKDALLALLATWCTKAKEHRDAHENASLRLRRWHYIFGVPAIVLSSLVAVAVFATLQRPVSTGVAVGVGVLSVAAAVLAACQTLLRSSDRAEAHRLASAEYEGLADRAELAYALGQSGPVDEDRLQKLREACGEVQAQMARLATKRPELAVRDRSPRVQAKSAPAPSSLPPLATSSVPASIPPPARVPLGTLPPVRAPQPHASAEAAAGTGAPLPSWAPPPPEGAAPKPR
jgi:hypothetical protein